MLIRLRNDFSQNIIQLYIFIALTYKTDFECAGVTVTMAKNFYTRFSGNK